MITSCMITEVWIMCFGHEFCENVFVSLVESLMESLMESLWESYWESLKESLKESLRESLSEPLCMSFNESLRDHF